MIHILIKDKVDPFVVEQLKQKGFIVNVSIDHAESLLREVKENEILIVRSATKVNEEVIDSAAQTNILKMIIRAGVGMDNIKADYARSKGIQVVNTPDASSLAVAELALAHMFVLAKKIVIANSGMREKKWNKKQCEGIELSGKTLGVIGMGRIGRILAKKASALDMKIVYFDIIKPIDVDSSWKSVSMDELLGQSDFISLHIPANHSDKGFLIDESEFKKMKKSAFLINTARGNLVNEEALIKALDYEEIAGAGIDVYCQEPCNNSSLIQHEKISVTPHVGGSTKEAQFRIGERMIEMIEDYQKNKLLKEGMLDRN